MEYSYYVNRQHKRLQQMKRNLLLPKITLTESELNSTLTRLAKNPMWGEGDISLKSDYIPDEVAKFLLNTYPREQ